MEFPFLDLSNLSKMARLKLSQIDVESPIFDFLITIGANEPGRYFPVSELERYVRSYDLKHLSVDEQYDFLPLDSFLNYLKLNQVDIVLIEN